MPSISVTLQVNSYKVSDTSQRQLKNWYSKTYYSKNSLKSKLHEKTILAKYV